MIKNILANSSSSSKIIQISRKQARQAYNNLNNLYYEITFDNNPRRISIEDLLLHIYNDDQVSKLVDSIPWSFYRTEVDESSYPGINVNFNGLWVMVRFLRSNMDLKG